MSPCAARLRDDAFYTVFFMRYWRTSLNEVIGGSSLRPLMNGSTAPGGCVP